jgi:hypothetical protein
LRFRRLIALMSDDDVMLFFVRGVAQATVT